MVYPRFEKARNDASAPPGDGVTFSPMREKVTKERIFVRSELMPLKRRKWDKSMASIGAHSSGGIVRISAQMWVVEFRLVALCVIHMA